MGEKRPVAENRHSPLHFLSSLGAVYSGLATVILASRAAKIVSVFRLNDRHFQQSRTEPGHAHAK